MKVDQARGITDDLRTLWEHAVKRLASHRGGPELYNTIRRDADDDQLLTQLVAAGAIWIISDEDQLVGFALLRDEVVEGVFVNHDHRRKGVATTLLKSLMVGEGPPNDGLALPGDRGMKSLYESLGWKARLLTMRGE